MPSLNKDSKSKRFRCLACSFALTIGFDKDPGEVNRSSHSKELRDYKDDLTCPSCLNGLLADETKHKDLIARWDTFALGERDDPLKIDLWEDWDLAHNMHITDIEAETIRNKYATYGINGYDMGDVIYRNLLAREMAELIVEIEGLNEDLLAKGEDGGCFYSEGVVDDKKYAIQHKENRIFEIEDRLSTPVKKIALDM